jgi:hypothetical protein
MHQTRHPKHTPAYSPSEASDWPSRIAEMDKLLKKQGLVVLDSREWLSFKKNIAARMYASRFHFRFPRTSDLVGTPEEFWSFLNRLAKGKTERPKALSSRQTELAASRMSDVLGASPTDLKDSHLHALLAKGHFGTPQDEVLPNYDTKKVPDYFQSKPCQEKIRRKPAALDPKLPVIAFLISRNLVTEELVEIYLPEISYADFHRHRSKIHREVEATLPERFKRFQKYWDSLTTPQKQALRLVHMAYGQRSTYPEAAATLGITVNALKERLKTSTSKLRQFYPELIPLQDQPKGADVWKESRYDSLKIVDLERVKIPLPVTRLDPVTLKPIKTWKQKKTKIRTPIAGLAETILAWNRERYEPFHDGVGSPRLAHMTAIPPERTLAVLSAKNQVKARARIQEYEETGIAVLAVDYARLARNRA